MTAITGNIPRKPNTGTPKFEADPMNSTFRWEIYLTQGQHGNKVPILDGYSKGMGYENTSRVDLLYKKLINPILPYLHKSDTIVIYQQDPGLPKHLHPVVLELLPRQYFAYDWVGQTTPITHFLDRYYNEFIYSGTMPPTEDRRKNARQAFYHAELDHTRHSFASLEELHNFCYQPSRIAKHSATCMEKWYYIHAQYQPELFENGPQLADNLQHAKDIAPNSDSAQAAQNSLQALYNRHPSSPKRK
ncbi:hypothetical protein GO755_33620 [Spirosoma sp. HMF4905]|uniref:Uncharacterized protein n=1 Tax=Spirosoma arboris TaxID=2682092 RepID=A0A7K1SMJ3_9BACT|nr:hypothetical protein [Spirosoma arboris]MVM35015.1 hypothetical protein [Spirosoma arboris]